MTHILLVDDDLDIREALSEILRLYRYEVETAANGAEALARLRAGPPPAVILLDLMMPVMNGWRFRELQLEDPGLRAIPVLIITGVNNPEEQARELAAAGYVTKPFDIDKLLRMVSRYTGAGLD